MNIKLAIQKLGKNEKLESDEFHEITKFLIDYNIKSKETSDSYKLYINYLLDYYEKDVIFPEIKKFLREIFRRRSDGYFYYYGDVVNSNTFKKITNYEKHEYFLELWFENPLLYGNQHNFTANVPSFIIHDILNSLKSKEDKEKFCVFLSKKKNYNVNNDTIGLLYQMKNYEFIKHLLAEYKIELQKGKDIANIIIKNNGIINDSFIYQMALKNTLNFQPNFEPNIHNYIFENYKFTENDLDIILGCNNISMLLHIISNSQFDDNYKLKKIHFVILLKQNKSQEILNLMQKQKIQNIENVFDIFWSELETNFYSNINGEINAMFNIYKLFCENMNNACNEHLSLFLQKKWYYLSDYLIKEKKIVANDMNYLSYVSSNPNLDLFEDYFPELNLTIEHLRLACLYQLEPIVKIILNNKILPTQICYRALFEYININKPVIPQIVDLLIFGGYNLTYDDILIATKYGVELNKSIFTIKFEPKEDFYDLCTSDFKPEYNENMYRDIIWIRKWCKCACRGSDFTEIKRNLKKYNLKLDDICKENLLKNKVTNKPKQELLMMCNF